MMRKNKEKGLKIAMLGQKEVPSRSGGIEVVLTTLCPLLVEKGNFVTCYNRSHEKSEEEYKEIQGRKEYKGVSLKKVWTLNRNGLSAVTASFSAAILAAIGKYDIVHFHAEGPAAALWIPKMFGKRCVVTVHGLDWKREKWSGTFGSKYIKFWEKVLVKYADRIIVLSEDVQRYFKDTYHRDTVFIPNGVSKNKVREADLITEKFGLEKGEYFCSVSRLTEEKGILDLIQAYKALDTNKKLVIVGDDSKETPYIRKIKDSALESENIIFTGFASGKLLDELYSNSFAYIIASSLEGMPLSLLEALSYGSAVIGSNIPEITEVIEDKELIFTVGNVEELSQKMKMLLDNPELVARMRKSSIELVTQKYNWDEVADKTLELYKGIKKYEYNSKEGNVD